MSVVDRQKVETILLRRFPGSHVSQIAAAVNAVMGLGDEWEEVVCPDPDHLTDEIAHGSPLLVFRRNDHDHCS